jgi:predicted dehydrogenase
MGKICRVFLAESWGEIKAGEWVELPTPEGRPNERTAYVDAFAQAVLADADPPVPGRQGRRSLEIVRGAYLSMQRGRPVEFPVRE